MFTPLTDDKLIKEFNNIDKEQDKQYFAYNKLVKLERELSWISYELLDSLQKEKSTLCEQLNQLKSEIKQQKEILEKKITKHFTLFIVKTNLLCNTTEYATIGHFDDETNVSFEVIHWVFNNLFNEYDKINAFNNLGLYRYVEGTLVEKYLKIINDKTWESLISICYNKLPGYKTYDDNVFWVLIKKPDI